MKLLIIFVICVVIYGVLTTPSPPCKEVTDPYCNKCCRRTDELLLETSERIKYMVNGSYNSPMKNCNTCKIHVPNEAFERSAETCAYNIGETNSGECRVQYLTVKLFHVNVTCSCKFQSENKNAESGLMNIVWQQDPEVSLLIKRCRFIVRVQTKIYNYTVVNPVASVDILRKCEGNKQFIKECMIFAQSLKDEDMQKHILNIAHIYFTPKKQSELGPIEYSGNFCLIPPNKVN